MIDMQALEAAKRWMERMEDDGTIAGYDWEDHCLSLGEDEGYDSIDDLDRDDSLQAFDAEAAGRSASTRSTPLPAVREGGRYGHGVPASSVGKVSDDQAA